MSGRLARPRGPVVLCIMDGVGLGAGGEDDAVASARTPTLDMLLATCPHLALVAHGKAVGLPSDADMGNSEVGHNAMGAGQVVDQGASLVSQAVDSGAIFETDAWQALVATRTLHLLGLVSDGNVHSHISHLNALIEGAVRSGVRRLRLHLLTDGRDVPARSALVWVRPLERTLEALALRGVDAQIASGGGRMHITMDRYEADWPMVARGWACHVRGVGRPFPSASAAIEDLYGDPDLDDQWLPAFVVCRGEEPVGRIEDGDGVLLFNFRGDRAIEISRAFEDVEFNFFDRGPRPDVVYAGMMQYDGDRRCPTRFLVSPPAITDTVGRQLVAAGLRTFACAETQKFGHVTYFFNGNRSGRLDERLETWCEVTSDVRPFEQAPWMKAAEVTDRVLEALAGGGYDHIRLNYANGDMVGHSGALEATRVAVEAVDLQLARLLPAIHAAGGVLLLTADHGNADEMWQHDRAGAVVRDAAGQPVTKTSHTLNPVPFVLVDARGSVTVCDDLASPGIASIGSTILRLLGLDLPEAWAPALVRLV